MLALFLALACGGEDTGFVYHEAPIPVPRQEGVVHVAQTRAAPIPLPPRYATSLARVVQLGEPLDEGLLPPAGWYAHQVCLGTLRYDWWEAVVFTAGLPSLQSVPTVTKPCGWLQAC